MMHFLAHAGFAVVFLAMGVMSGSFGLGLFRDAAVDADLPLDRVMYYAMGVVMLVMAIGCFVGAVYACLPC